MMHPTISSGAPAPKAWQAVLAVFLILAGCQANQQTIADDLDAGEVALGGNRYDVAVEYANQVLHITPSPQAFYIRARAEEDRPKPDPNIAAADLDKARADYQAALDQHPPRDLAARCRAGLANIAFTQEDYSTAIFQWLSAVDDLGQAQWRATALYRVGESQQRLGRFEDADKTFQRVADQYPDQDVAAKARAHAGIRAFYIQLGSFNKSSDAQAALDAADKAGLKAKQTSDQGLIAVRAGPYGTYGEAKSARGAIVAQFPDAAIQP